MLHYQTRGIDVKLYCPLKELHVTAWNHQLANTVIYNTYIFLHANFTPPEEATLNFEGNLANKSIYSGWKRYECTVGVNVEQIYSNRSFHHQAVERALQLGLNENSRVVCCFGHKCAYSQCVIVSHWASAGINNSRATATLFISDERDGTLSKAAA